MSFARFKYWFVNVFLYHYKWVTLGVIAALVLAGSLIYSIATNKDPDFMYIFAGIGYRGDTVTEDLNARLRDAFGDLNGDGALVYDGQYIDLDQSETADAQMVMVNTTRFIGTLSSRECALLIYHEGALDDFLSMLEFADLTASGIETLPDNPCAAEITGHPDIPETWFPDMRIYAGVLRLTEEDVPPRAAEVNALEALRLLTAQVP